MEPIAPNTYKLELINGYHKAEVVLMAIKKDIEYEIKPGKVDPGERWITVTVTNVGDNAVRQVNVRLNSLDTYGLNVVDDSKYIPILAPDEKQEVYFKVNAKLTTGCYVTLDGYKDSELYYWESPTVFLRVGTPKAELTNAWAMRQEHILVGDTIKVEATVKSNMITEDLSLEFWSEGPEGEIEEMDTLDTGELEAGQSKVFETELVPSKQGLYTVDIYLYDGNKRLGHKAEYAIVEEA